MEGRGERSVVVVIVQGRARVDPPPRRVPDVCIRGGGGWGAWRRRWA